MPSVRVHGWSVAGGLWLLLDVLRMWTPSLITVFGRAAETPAELIGAFALGVCAVPFLLTLQRRVGERVALVVLVVARIGMYLTHGDRPQLVLASVGTVAGIWWLALVVGTRARSLAPGLALGLLLSTAAHAALATYGAVWRHDVWSAVVLLAQIGLVAGSERSPAEAPSRVSGRLVFPVLLLAGVLFANAGRASATVGELGPALAVVGCVLAVLATSAPPRHGLAAAAGVVLVVVTAVGLLAPLAGLPAVVAALPFVLGLPAAFVLLSGAVSPDLEPGLRRADPGTVAAGAVLWVVLLFAYYAGYDLGYRADLVLVAVAVVVAVVGIRASPVGPPAPWMAPARTTYAVGVLAVVVALVGPVVTLRPLDRPAPAGSAPTGTLHVAAWNLRMGYGIDGRFDARAVAGTLLREHVDVALVSEIDRGWLLNGGQDQLRILARLTGMHVAFGAAADPVWGDAILSRAPLREVISRPFPSYGAVTGAEVLQARLDWNGTVLTVVSTHLQPGAGGTDDTVGQAGGLARLLRRDAELGPVIAGGDLNTEPGSRAWATITAAGLSDALAPARPLLTSSSDDPTEQIDHLFASPDLSTSRPRTLDSELSDHLPVLLDVRVPPG